MSPRLRSLRSLVHVIVVVLVILLVGSAAVTGAARATVAGAQRTLSERILPARHATSDGPSRQRSTSISRPPPRSSA